MTREQQRQNERRRKRIHYQWRSAIDLLQQCRALLRLELHALTAAACPHGDPDPRLQTYYHLVVAIEELLQAASS